MNPINIKKVIQENGTQMVKKVTSDNVEMLSIEERTVDFLKRISNSTKEVILDFLENKTQKIPTRYENNKLYLYDNLILARTDGNTAYNIEENIKQLKGKDFAPSYIKYFEMGENDYLTVLGVNTDKLLPYSSNLSKVSKQTKLKFKQNVEDMLNSGVVNKEIFANKENLLISENGEKIIVADWSELCRNSNAAAYKSFLSNWQM